MSEYTPAKEIVKDLLDVIDNDDTLFPNRRALAELDGEELDTYVKNLEEQIEETEYIFYNAEDWIDNVLPVNVEKLENRILGEIEMISPVDKIRLTELLEEFVKDLTGEIGKEVMGALDKITKVYS